MSDSQPICSGRLRRCLPVAGAATLILTMAAAAAAQDLPTFFGRTAFSGYVDTYYAYNRNNPATPCAVVNGVEIFNCLHAFDVARNSFSLNMAALDLQKAPTPDSRAGFRIDLAFGAGPELIAGQQSDPNRLSQGFLQAYASYLVSTRARLSVDVGKFLTPAGFERVDPRDDWNGSRSLLFALAIPRDHVGVRALYSPNTHVALTALLANGWNDVTANAGRKLVGASVTVRPNGLLTMTETYLGGTERSLGLEGWRDLSDTFVISPLTRRLLVGFNADFGRDRRTAQSWQGYAAYFRYQPNNVFAFIPRLESLRDPDGFMTGVSQDLQEATATAEFRDVHGIVFRLEYRVDVADRPYFLRGVSTTVRTQSVASAYCVVFFNTRGASQPEQAGVFSALRKKQ